MQKRFILKTPIGLQNWELLHHNIQLGRVLGEGAFGSVLAGKLTLADKQIDVAIKMVSQKPKPLKQQKDENNRLQNPTTNHCDSR